MAYPDGQATLDFSSERPLSAGLDLGVVDVHPEDAVGEALVVWLGEDEGDIDEPRDDTNHEGQSL